GGGLYAQRRRGPRRHQPGGARRGHHRGGIPVALRFQEDLMIAEPVAAAGPSADRPADLFDFFEKVRTTNPFLNNRVDRALDPSFIDVPAIHEAAFDTVVGLGKQALAEDRGLGVVVWGEAGMCTSHL